MPKSFIVSGLILAMAATGLNEAAPQNTSEWGDPASYAEPPPPENTESIAAAEALDRRNFQRMQGIKFYNGDGAPQDKPKALEWFRKAADQGDATSQFIVGAMLAEGDGVTANVIEANMWWILAAARGSNKARDYKSRLEITMTAEQITKSQQLAAAWRKRSSKLPR